MGRQVLILLRASKRINGRAPVFVLLLTSGPVIIGFCLLRSVCRLSCRLTPFPTVQRFIWGRWRDVPNLVTVRQKIHTPWWLVGLIGVLFLVTTLMLFLVLTRLTIPTKFSPAFALTLPSPRISSGKLDSLFLESVKELR